MWALAAWLVFLACSPSRFDHERIARHAARDGFTVETLALGPHRVLVRHGGSGPAVVLLHGFGGDGLWGWRRQLGALVQDHRVVVPDLLWFGGSSSSAPPTLESQADAVVATLDGLGVDRFTLVGSSYGGFVALAVLQAAPERVAGLVLVDSPADTFPVAALQATAARLGVARVDEVFVPDSPRDVQRLVGVCSTGRSPLPRFVARDLLRQGYADRPTEKAALLDDLRAHGALALPALPPALVVWGAQDAVFPVAYARPTADRLGADLAVFEHAAHCPNYEVACAFNARLQAFLDGLQPPPR